MANIVDTLINARWVLPIAPHNHILEHHSIAINQGRISALLPTPLAAQQLSAKQTINLDDHVLMPGLVNAHAHSPMTLFRGLADDLPLMDWLQQHIWPAEQAIINAESVADGTRLAILEMLRGGTTCFAENYFFHDTTANIAQECGMRCSIGLLIIQVPTAWAKDEKEYLDKARTTLEAHAKQTHPLLHWSIAPHSPYMVSESGLLECQTLAEQFDLPIHVHLHESKEEIQHSLQHHQLRPIAYFKKLGLLSSRLFGVHMVQVNEDDLEMMAAAGASVVHCPESNLKLANGFAPVQSMLNKGINVALGTDGTASNNDLDMLGEMRSAALIAKAYSANPTAVSAATALAMATLHGAKALKLDHEIGSIEVGKFADVIAINMNHYFTQPIYNPMSHLVYAANRLQVSDVWIAGNHLLQQGKFTQMDVQSIIQRAQRWAEQAQAFSSRASLTPTC